MSRIYLFCLLLIHIYGSITAQEIMCIENDLTYEKLQIKCTVDQLIYNVDIIYPSATFGFAYCVAPTSLTKETGETCFCKCLVSPNCKCNLTQNLDTKATTLVIEGSDLNKMNGTFLCQHGSYSKSININNECYINNKCSSKCSDKKIDEQFNVWMIVALVSISIGCILCTIIWRCHRKKKGTLQNGVEEQRLLDMNKPCNNLPGREAEKINTSDKIEQFCGNVNCHKGVQIVADVICIECTLAYCRTCLQFHQVDKPAHQICPIQRVTCLTSHTEIICNSCFIMRIDRFCKECLTPICESCTNDHKHEGRRNAKMSIIYPITLGQKRQKTKQIIKHQYNVSIKKEENDRFSICGLSFVENGKLVVVDSVNRMIIVFGSEKEQFRKKLEDEPRAMTAMTGNKIAITFAYTKLIRIFQISEETVDIIDSEQIYLPDVGLPNSKPFSIAFDSEFFAVEVGEGDDGKIIILNKQKIHKSITNDKNFAFFTGNTIRLAVEVKTKEPLRGRIYVSAVDKKMVICVDFEGNKLWYTSVQGPRGIIIVQQESMKTNLIVACRRSNTIISISEDGGNEEVLLERNEIKSPRYMSYHKIKEQLCIQVAKNNNEDELSFFSFDHPFQQESQL